MNYMVTCIVVLYSQPEACEFDCLVNHIIKHMHLYDVGESTTQMFNENYCTMKIFEYLVTFIDAHLAIQLS